MPYTDGPPSSAPVLTTLAEGRSIHVDVAPVGEACRYLIEWREACDEHWSSHDTYDGTAESLAWTGAGLMIRDLNPRSLYAVRARAGGYPANTR